MKVIELDQLDEQLQDQLLAAVHEPVVITQNDRPVLIVRNLLDDDAVDDVLIQHSAFLESIQRARQQKANGQVRQLSELRQKYGIETNAEE
jgi:hypothetical protein